MLMFVVASAQQTRKIIIDFQQEKGTHNKFFKKCIGAGRANEGLRADWQDHLRIVKQACDFKYIRFHGILHDDMGVYTETEDSTPIYNWQYVDKLYDYILEIGMKPFVELSFMPSALASGEKTVFWWKGNVTPPKSYEKYFDLIQAFTQHLTERYGEEEVKTWYFEVWNEPNHGAFFSGNKAEYFKMYSSAVKAVRSVSPVYRVGGPATAGCGWISDMLNYCNENNDPIDFIATHTYNVHGALDEFGKKQLRMDSSPFSVVNGVKYVHRKMDESEASGLELHFTEWSSSYSPKDPIHDTYQNAAFVLNTLKNVEGVASSMSYWVFTDVFEEPGVPASPFHGGFGLVNLQGIKKPTFFIYDFLNQLGDTELVNSDSCSWVCKQDNDLQLLVWDFTYPDQGKEFNQVFYRQKHQAQDKGVVEIKTSNMSDGVYALSMYQTGYKRNDAFSAFFEMGLPSQLTHEQEKYLKKVTEGQPLKTEVIEINGGVFQTRLELRENDVFLIKLNKL